nr:MAG TPA: hypothetical protein [Caudoviricetes sp.]DAT69707.1 MAG TPA: hypothetical protein [Caudoviricetes sp.]
MRKLKVTCFVAIYQFARLQKNMGSVSLQFSK